MKTKVLNLHDFFELLEKFHVQFGSKIQTDGNGLVWFDEYDKPSNRKFVIGAVLHVDYLQLQITSRREPAKFGDVDRNCTTYRSSPGVFPRDWYAQLSAYADGSEATTERASAVTRCLERMDDMQAAVDNMRASAPESCQDLDALIEGSRNDIVQFLK